MAFLTTSVLGLHSKWCNWIHRFVNKGSVGNKVNDDICHYFQTQKGHPSPILFNIVAHVLVILISRAKEDGQVDLLIPHLVDG
jgi:hypothetical protein